MKFTDKVVIVTGGANGIGKEIATMYAENGANVVLADIDIEAGKSVKENILQNGGNVEFVLTDVSKEESVQQLFSHVHDKFSKVDILINNAGKSIFKPFFEMSLNEWDDVLSTNLRSVFLCSKEAARVMRKGGTGGSIVNIASTRAMMSEPNSEAYAASKGGMVAITHALAATLGEYGITVNAISPGWIETGEYDDLREKDHKQHFSGRVGKPADIARACLYLTSPENNFVTGTNLVVDGGMTRKMLYEE
ncbi:SDR family NAD(P)-dependent oxidoreductase [Bacillus sp. FJAT-45066]|uniref:SDR family NAD(P)-dependent oxidoreductase n=1 Tax=Bacillus sp. FJAT-45066 TaxID=2011010 RepID=UPI000BB81B4A|nr:glucose 1-dehydrogenase [Bacillus sp. FJAT-45066]